MHDADVVLCAANGIGTPRLLLASATAAIPHGLANDSGLVGRGLMLHPMTLVQGTLPDASPGTGTTAGSSTRCSSTPPTLHAVSCAGARWALTGGGQPLARRARPHRRMGSRASSSRMREQVGRRLQWVLLAEDLPEDHNRVTLAAEPPTARACPGSASAIAPATNTERLLAWHAAAGARIPERSRCGRHRGRPARGPTATSWAPPAWATTRRHRSATAGVSPTASGISGSSTAASSRPPAA